MWSRISLRLQLAALLLLFVVFSLALVRISVRAGQAEALIVHKNSPASVRIQLKQVMTDLEELADRLPVQSLRSGAGASGCSRALSEAMVLIPYVSNIEVSDSDGRILCSTLGHQAGKTLHADPRHGEAYRRQLIRTARLARVEGMTLPSSYSDPGDEQTRAEGRPQWVVPVLTVAAGPDGNAPKLTVAFHLDAGALLKRLSDSHEAAPDATYAVAFRMTPYVFHSDEGSWGVLSRGRPVAPMTGDDVLEKALDKPGYNPSFWVMSWERVSGTPWSAMSYWPPGHPFLAGLRSGAHWTERPETMTMLVLLVSGLLIFGLGFRLLDFRIRRSSRELVGLLKSSGSPPDVDLGMGGPREIAWIAEQVQETLREQSRAGARYRSVMQNAPMPIFLTTPSGEVVEGNQAFFRALGFSDGGSVSLHETDFFSEESEWKPQVEEVLKRGLAAPIETEWVLADSTKLPVRIHRTTLRTDAGDLLVEAVAEDLSDHPTHSGQAQRDYLAVVARLAGGVAHNFNNALTTIRGQAELLSEELPQGPEREGVERIITQSDRLALLTSQLLAFSRSQVTMPEMLYMDRWLYGFVPHLEALIERRVDVSVNENVRSTRVLVDKGHLERILINLLLNAKEATEPGDPIEVRCEMTEALCRPMDDRVDGIGMEVILQVRDYGKGIPSEVLEHVFDPFFTTKDLSEGAGMGLASVGGLVEQNGGRIEITSETGEGTTVKVSFPAYEPGLSFVNRE